MPEPITYESLFTELHRRIIEEMFEDMAVYGTAVQNIKMIEPKPKNLSGPMSGDNLEEYYAK